MTDIEVTQELAATAAHIPGLEALYEARLEVEHIRAEIAKRDRQEQIEQVRKEREVLGKTLAAYGIKGIAPDGCALGSWRDDDSSSWCYNGAKVSWYYNDSAIVLSVFVDRGDSELDERIGKVMTRYNHVDDERRASVDCRAALIDLLERAAKMSAEPIKAPEPVATPMDSNQSRPYYIIANFVDVISITRWANENFDKGYASLQIVADHGDLYAIMADHVIT